MLLNYLLDVCYLKRQEEMDYSRLISSQKSFY